MRTLRSHARRPGHPSHHWLMVFPLGLLATAVVFDLIDLATGTGAFAVAAYWMIAAGISGALVAAPFGLIDWLHVSGASRARRVGALHGIGNGLVLLMFAASWLLRDDQGMVPAAAVALSLAGAAVATVRVWLEGERVSRLGMGVQDNAEADAPSSLSLEERPSRPAARAH